MTGLRPSHSPTASEEKSVQLQDMFAIITIWATVWQKILGQTKPRGISNLPSTISGMIISLRRGAMSTLIHVPATTSVTNYYVQYLCPPYGYTRRDRISWLQYNSLLSALAVPHSDSGPCPGNLCLFRIRRQCDRSPSFINCLPTTQMTPDEQSDV
jgi:hypothetical protein